MLLYGRLRNGMSAHKPWGALHQKKKKDDPEVVLEKSTWACPKCIRTNNFAHWQFCGMCGTPKPKQGA